MPTDIRPAATAGELRDALRVRHVAFRKKLPLLAYEAAMLGWARGRWSTPWIVVEDGSVVATLVAHDLTLALDGARFPGYGLGSVSTLPDHRRRGHAAALCRAVCEHEEAGGRTVGVLFSAIAPAYYERLGFVRSPAWEWKCDRLGDLAASGPAAELTPVDPRGMTMPLAALWQRFHRGRLHAHRDPELFLRSVEIGPRDWFLGVGGGEDGAARGYVRVAKDADGEPLEIVEPVLLDPADELPVLRALARLALDASLPGLEGWLEPSDAVRAWFTEVPRDTTLPMLRGAPSHARFTVWGSDHV